MEQAEQKFVTVYSECDISHCVTDWKAQRNYISCRCATVWV